MEEKIRMETVIKQINFNFSPTSFVQAAKSVFPSKVVNIFDLNIDKLNKIADEVGESQFKFNGDNSIPHVYKKFKSFVKSGEFRFDYFERRELRALTYALSYSEGSQQQIFSSTVELNLVFKTLENNWKDSFLIGLIECYLENWESPYLTSLENTEKFILNKLKLYEGGRKILQSFKKNSRFFSRRNGDVVLGVELALNVMNIKDAAKYLSLPESWFSYQYFSKVIVSYYDKRKKNVGDFLDDLTAALKEHNNSVSNKRLVCKLIIQANIKEFSSLQDKVKSIAFRFVGDPSNSTNWTSFEFATESESTELKNARKILNEWITRQFINVFFERCINDPRRKRFWLKYAKEITQFRVVGSSEIKELLLSDIRIREYVFPRFARTNSTRDHNAALMFTMKNHLFIEFSDTGAFYAYKLSNKNAPSIEHQFFESTSSLKTPTMKFIAYRKGFDIGNTYDEGRLGHNDGDMYWEDVASYWLKNIADIDV